MDMCGGDDKVIKDHLAIRTLVQAILFIKEGVSFNYGQVFQIEGK
jgi:hypothetical protein